MGEGKDGVKVGERHGWCEERVGVKDGCLRCKRQKRCMDGAMAAGSPSYGNMVTQSWHSEDDIPKRRTIIHQM